MPSRTNNVHKFIHRWVDQSSSQRLDRYRVAEAIIKKQTSAGQYVALVMRMGFCG